MSAGKNVHHTGTCSDCGAVVDTRNNGDCFHHSGPVDKIGGSVFLCCYDCKAKRQKKDKGDGWLPGPKHDVANIKVERT